MELIQIKSTSTFKNDAFINSLMKEVLTCSSASNYRSFDSFTCKCIISLMVGIINSEFFIQKFRRRANGYRTIWLTRPQQHFWLKSTWTHFKCMITQKWATCFCKWQGTSNFFCNYNHDIILVKGTNTLDIQL